MLPEYSGVASSGPGSVHGDGLDMDGRSRMLGRIRGLSRPRRGLLKVGPGRQWVTSCGPEEVGRRSGRRCVNRRGPCYGLTSLAAGQRPPRVAEGSRIVGVITNRHAPVPSVPRGRCLGAVGGAEVMTMIVICRCHDHDIEEGARLVERPGVRRLSTRLRSPVPRCLIVSGSHGLRRRPRRWEQQVAGGTAHSPEALP